MKRILFTGMMILFLTAGVNASTFFLDNFEYGSDEALQVTYQNQSDTGTGLTYVRSSTEKTEGLYSMQCDITYDGSQWLSAVLIHTRPEAFDLRNFQTLRIRMKGSTEFASRANTFVFKLFDINGQAIRYYDSTTLGHDGWQTLEIPIAGFEEDPYDAGPTVNADKSQILSWGFYFQNGTTEAFSATIYVDDMELDTNPPGLSEYVVNLITPAQAPNVTDNIFDAIYSAEGEEISSWKTDGEVDVASPYDASRAYMVTDGDKVYFGIKIGDNDTSSLVCDTADDSWAKWNADSWEISFASNYLAIDGANYIKLSGDSCDYMDDMYPDSAAGTSGFDIPSLEHNAYIIDGNSWAAEFSLDVSDLSVLAGEPRVYGHIGVQAKDPAVNFAFPKRSSFGSRDCIWNFSSLFTAADASWNLYE